MHQPRKRIAKRPIKVIGVTNASTSMWRSHQINKIQVMLKSWNVCIMVNREDVIRKQRMGHVKILVIGESQSKSLIQDNCGEKITYLRTERRYWSSPRPTKNNDPLYGRIKSYDIRSIAWSHYQNLPLKNDERIYCISSMDMVWVHFGGGLTTVSF